MTVVTPAPAPAEPLEEVAAVASAASDPVVRFWRRLFAFWAPVALLLGGVELVAWKSGETLPIERVIERQSEQPGVLFMRRFVGQDFYRYKVVNVLRQRPRVLVAGSSRAMEFRRGMFGPYAAQFYNAGGAVQNAADLQTFAGMLDAAATPKVLIVGIDMWWLNPGWREAEGLSNGVSIDSARTWKGHLAGLRALVSSYGELSTFAEAAMLAGSNGSDHIGIEARIRRAGFREDGSMDYGPAAVRPAAGPFVDPEKPSVIERINGGFGRFEFAAGISDVRLTTLLSAVAAWQRRGVTVVAFLPPVWSGAADALSRDPRQSGLWSDYRTRLPAALRAAGVPVMDASTPAMLGFGDAAMIDGFHGDESFHRVLTAKILDLAEVRAALSGTRP